MKKLLVLLLFYAPALYGQVSYAPACSDTIYEEEDKFCSECGDHQFFGGAEQFKRFLKINLLQKIKKGEIKSGTVVVLVHIDTLGQTQKVDILSKMDCESCNQTILGVMKTIKRWEPYCYYLNVENKIVCEEKDLKITITIRDKQIFLLTTE
jgi:hypothetical protein